MRHTPVELVFLLQVHYMDTESITEPLSTSKSRDKAIEKWLKRGMIQREAGNPSNFRTTVKAKFFIEHLCNQPLPVEETTWHIPTPKEID